MTGGIAFVGAGTVAELYAKALERGVPGQFVGVHDPDRAAAARIAGRLGGVVFDTLDALVASSKVDAVVVMSPTDTHEAVATACLEARKHVLLEKPVARTRSAIDALSRLAAEAGRVCMPAHNYIYHPGMERSRRLIADGRLGRVASLWMIYNVFHDDAVAARYGGVTRAVAVHHAYTLLYLLGRPARVLAARSQLGPAAPECEDQVMMVCEMPGGALANLWASFAASDRTNDPWTVVCKVLGTGGSTSFTWSDAVIDDDGGPAWGLPNYVDSFHTELEFFLGEAIGRGAAPRSTLADARDALALIEAAERSAASGSGFEVPEY